MSGYLDLPDYQGEPDDDPPEPFWLWYVWIAVIVVVVGLVIWWLAA